MNSVKEVVPATAVLRRCSTIGRFVAAAALITAMTLPASAAGKFVSHNTPRYVSTAKNLGTENPSKTIEVSIWLQPHNRAGMDALARQLYDRNSPNYRRFLNRAQFAARFAPTAEEAKTVRDFFESRNLKVVTVGPHNMFVRARGTVGDVENAFHVVLNNYLVDGKTIRANDRDPYVDGAAAAFVRTISGLDTGKFQHPLATRTATLPNKTTPGVRALNAVSRPDSLGYSNICFDGTVTRKYSNNNDGSQPVATYHGNHINLFGLTTPGCGYTPPMIQTAYNLKALYNEGFDGSGQTIGIIDWCGSSTIRNDANVFSAQFGLPALTSSNFAVTNIPFASVCESADQVEINIDVEWAHAVAPGANINLIVPPDAFFQDIDEAEYIAIDSGLANVLSGSYGAEEIFVPASELQNGNLLSEIGAIFGISTNFSTGDDGDFTFGLGFTPSVSYPADSPFATAIGGVTVALNSNNSIAWQAGWGNNETLLAEEGFVADPPLVFGFNGGSGGGASSCATQDSDGNCLAGFPKPWYQKGVGVPGTTRQLPDISWVADPFAGVVIAITVPGQVPSLVWQVWGGTSVACPMFSALWAIANQEAGAPLGQAAPYAYNRPAGAITDIVQVGSKTDVNGSIVDSDGTTKYTTAEVGGVPTGKFVSAIWDYAPEAFTGVVLTFGTDSGLKTHPGWDNVTGVGVPNPKAFADSFAPPASK